MLKVWLEQSSYTTVLTGAGMSTESGIPDFRSSQGLWKTVDPVRLASTYALQHNRDDFVAFYRQRIEGLRNCKPNRGHYILAEWERQNRIQAVITQNVDGFHQQAGSVNVAELHGRIYRLYCMRCDTEYDASRYLQAEGQRCECGGFIRPQVVLFGESLPASALDFADRVIARTELLIVMGSSLQVSPVNQYVRLAKQRGAKVIIINMEPTVMDCYADLTVQGQKIGYVLETTETDFAT